MRPLSMRCLIALAAAPLTFSPTVSAPSLAQAMPAPSYPPGVTRERAPGVPLAPNRAETERRGGQVDPGETGSAAREGDERRRAPEPNRDPPVPRPVPSIIQP